MDHREDARPPSGRRSGSEVAFSRSNFLDPYNVAYATLIPLTPAGRQQNPDLDVALATAVNDWQVAEWLDPERSEEHTSELQSRLHLVCRLLPGKKKKGSVKTRSESCA